VKTDPAELVLKIITGITPVNPPILAVVVTVAVRGSVTVEADPTAVCPTVSGYAIRMVEPPAVVVTVTVVRDGVTIVVVAVACTAKELPKFAALLTAADASGTPIAEQTNCRGTSNEFVSSDGSQEL
jgi:hypothetical protein